MDGLKYLQEAVEVADDLHAISLEAEHGPVLNTRLRVKFEGIAIQMFTVDADQQLIKQIDRIVAWSTLRQAMSNPVLRQIKLMQLEIMRKPAQAPDGSFSMTYGESLV